MQYNIMRDELIVAAKAALLGTETKKVTAVVLPPTRSYKMIQGLAFF